MKKLYIYIADSQPKRSFGLMNRRVMAENVGMLFKFPYSDNLRFWMKDTYIPLDIAFLDDDGVIRQIETMHPHSTKAICSKYLCKMALEVNKGWFCKNNVGIGNRVGGFGFKTVKLSQVNAPLTPGVAQPEEQQPQVKPEVVLNRSFEQILEDANIKNQKLTIVYETKKGLVLPPKIIVPPFEFEKDAEGRLDAIVKAWDSQTASWKSFLVDNIIDLEPLLPEVPQLGLKKNKIQEG